MGKTIRAVLLLALFTQGVCNLIVTGIQMVRPEWFFEYQSLTKNIDLTGFSLVFTLPVFCICVPLAEEFIFRRLLYGLMRIVFPIWVSVVAATIIFCIYHANIVQILYIVPFGITACLIYEKTGTMVYSFLYHMGFNSLGFALEGLTRCSFMNRTVAGVYSVVSLPLLIYFLITFLCVKNSSFAEDKSQKD